MTPLTVKQIMDAQLADAGDKSSPFAVDDVETAIIRLVGTVSGKAERATDFSFTLDDGIGRIDFIRWLYHKLRLNQAASSCICFSRYSSLQKGVSPVYMKMSLSRASGLVHTAQASLEA